MSLWFLKIQIIQFDITALSLFLSFEAVWIAPFDFLVDFHIDHHGRSVGLSSQNASSMQLNCKKGWLCSCCLYSKQDIY